MSTQMDVFVQMSAELTGFDASMFAPSVDPANLKKVYFDFILDKEPESFPELLNAYAAAQAAGGSGVLSAAVTGATPAPAFPPELVRLAMSVNKLWYLGSWYNPQNTNDQQVVSEQSYIRGLAWQVMQSHAMGNSPFTFGYWAKDPAASLALTTGNPAADGGAG